MQVDITGRNIELTDALREHVEQRLDALTKYFDGVISAHVVLCLEKARHIAEITMHANHLSAHGEDQTDDLYAAIDGATQKVEKQLKRHKDRLRSHRTRSSKQEDDFNFTVDILDEEEVLSQSPAPRVVRTKKFAVKPMTIDEAALQMDLFNKDFLVFRNAGTDKLNVLYRRKDGTYGLIEPYHEEAGAEVEV